MPLYDKSRKKKIYPFVRNKADGNRLKTIYSFFKQHPVFVLSSSAGTPTLQSLNFSLADTAGGDSITITGTNLAGASSCTVGGTEATITATSATTLTFTMPAKTSGTYSVQVSNSFGTSNSLTVEAWSPADLTSGTGWWRASYSGTPWTGLTSARNLTSDGSDPAVGTAVNGKTPADFNGTTNSINAGTLSNYIGDHPSIRATFAALIWIDTAVADPGAGLRYLGNGVMAELAGVWYASVFTQSAGTVYKLCLGALGSTTAEVLTTIPQGRWVLAQWGYDGTNLWVKVGDSARVTTPWTSAVGQPSTPSRTLKMGRANGAASFYDGRVLEQVVCNADQSDANLTKLRKYLECRYALTPSSLA